MNPKLALFLILLSHGYSHLYAQINPRHNRQQVRASFQKNIFINTFSRKDVQSTIASPVILIGAGVFALTNHHVINRYEVREERNEYMPGFRHHADNYLQYAPIAAVYGLNALGIKGRNNFANRTALMLKSEMIMIALTYSLKKSTAVPRPDTGDPTSFPSGHTAQAFAAATFMAKEYGHENIWYSVGAYTLATGIGAMRVMNNRHWISDVFAGAGIGILSTNLAYLTHQYKWGKKKNTSTVILPTYYGHGGGVSIVHGF